MAVITNSQQFRPISYRNGADDELMSFGLRAQSLASTTNDKADIMITMPKP